MLLVCTATLAAGFFAVLLLNTIISQGAFRQHELEIQLILLAEKEEALARAVQKAEAPLEVEKAARKLGMVPAAAPVFLSPVRRQGPRGARARTRADSPSRLRRGPGDPAHPDAHPDWKCGDRHRCTRQGWTRPRALDPAADPAASPAADPVVSPAPVPSQQGVNP